MNGKLIVIEGLDGSGKSTQVKCLLDRLKDSGIDANRIKLPNYQDPACEPVKMYLSGRLGNNPDSVNAYAASTFFAVDRYFSYNCYWKDDYMRGGVFISDRYTTSNAYHQLAKMRIESWDSYLDWLEDFEYNKMGIPKPDLVIYLDMPVDISQKLMSSRYEGIESKKDVHEKDVEYLNNCRSAARYACYKFGWEVVQCGTNGEPYSIKKISDEIFDITKKILFTGERVCQNRSRSIQLEQ